MAGSPALITLLASTACGLTMFAAAAPADDQRGRQNQPVSASRPLTTPESIAASPEFALQVALDRAGFSPGEIDGKSGAVTKRALAAFQGERGLLQTGEPDEASWSALGVAPGQTGAILTQYTIAADAVKGPFTERIPADMVEKSKLPALGYTSALEALAEKFHIAPALLKALNPQASFAAGESMTVPAVSSSSAAAGRRDASAQPSSPAASTRRSSGRGNRQSGAVGTTGTDSRVVVSVSKVAESLTVRDTTGKVIMFAPVTVGSEHDPLPIGRWKVTSVQRNPVFSYNPDLFWDANPAHTKARIPAGPNNPVGVVWIDLDRPHYGIHGTPEPSKIGYRQSHGCVRLTNWDAIRLASLVKAGTPVLFEP